MEPDNCYQRCYTAIINSSNTITEENVHFNYNFKSLMSSISKTVKALRTI